MTCPQTLVPQLTTLSPALANSPVVHFITHRFIALTLAALSVTGVLGASLSTVDKRQSGLGCNANGHVVGGLGVDIRTCEPGQIYTCTVTDETGCALVDTSVMTIEQLIVTNVATGQPLSGAASILSTVFTCPQEPLVACTVTFDQDYEIPFGISIVPL